MTRAGGFSVALPLRHGTPHAAGGSAADRSLEGDAAARCAESGVIANRATCYVDNASARLSCIGHTIAAKFERSSTPARYRQTVDRLRIEAEVGSIDRNPYPRQRKFAAPAEPGRSAAAASGTLAGANVAVAQVRGLLGSLCILVLERREAVLGIIRHPRVVGRPELDLIELVALLGEDEPAWWRVGVAERRKAVLSSACPPRNFEAGAGASICDCGEPYGDRNRCTT